MSMLGPKNFDARKELEDIFDKYPLVEQYFCNDQLFLMDAIDSLYNKLNLDSEDIPLSTIELLEV